MFTAQQLPRQSARPPAPPARDRAAGRRSASNLVILAVAVLVAAWLAHRPAVGGPGGVATFVGELAGLGAAVAALGTVALMARVPVVDEVLGTEGIFVWHRRAGIATAGLTALHVVAITAGYAASEGVALRSEAARLLTTAPDMLTAGVAATLLAAITVLSLRPVRKRLRYQTWLFTHWYVYPAVVLAFGHELSNGADFVHAPVARLVWTWLHVVVACSLAWYRLLLPAWRMLTHPLRVVEMTPEAPGVVSLTFAGRRLDEYGAKAGQYVRIRFLTRGGWWQSHPFSLSAAPTVDRLRLTVQAAGDHTAGLQRLRPGTRAVVSGAYGNLTAEARGTDRVALVGGGSGIIPLRALLEGLPPGVDVRVLYRAHDHAQVVLRDELDLLAFERFGQVDYLVGGRHPDPQLDVLSPTSLLQLVPDLPQRDVYLCGSAGFVAVVRRSLRQLGVPPRRIHAEPFDP